MSLRSWVGLIVAAALVASPLLNLLLLNWFPPPQMVIHLAPEQGRRLAGVRERAPAAGTMRMGMIASTGPGSGANLLAPFMAPSGPRITQSFVARGDARPPPGPPPFDLLTREEHGAAMRDMRRHFTLINLANIGTLMLAGALLLSLLLRRPVRTLLDAIGDIERGAAPAERIRGPREFRQIGAALQRMGTHLSASLRERELMLAGLSHDIRSPLARLQAAIELHATDHPGDFQPMQADIRDIDHIVHQCIDFVRDGRDEPLETLPFDALVRTALQRHDAGALQFDLGCAGIAVDGHRLGLVRLIRNLVDNALTHGAAPVRIATRREGAELLLRVEDRGPGIAAQDWQRLREPFERGNRARDGRGAGLGLAIVQRVAAAHGAQLRLCERTATQDFAVELRLPLQA